MIKGIGTDLVSVKRIAEIFQRHGQRFAEKILGPDELKEFAAAQHAENFLAKRFATKEAVTKAFGLGLSQGMRWQDIQLGHLPSGQPTVSLSGHAKQQLDKLHAATVHISLSDDNEMVCAFVVVE